MKLSKSGYLSYLRCPREFWLRHQMPDLFSGEDSLGVKYLKEMGYRVQLQAEALFGDGKFGKADSEKRFETERLLAKADIYADGCIYEVKSSGGVKDEHIDDLAFQKVVAELTGAEVRQTFLIHVNKEYVRQGEIDPAQLLKIVEVTELVDARLPETKEKIAEALAYLETEPDKSLSLYCGDKLKCAFISHFHQDLPEHTIFDINNFNAKKLDQLLGMGILNMKDVPDDFELTARQRRQVEIVKSGERHVSHPEIREMLGVLAYPIYFLDYETANPAIPLYDGYRPFQVVVFQFSVHVLDKDGDELRHREFLADGKTEPTPALLSAMREIIIDEGGTVVVWSAYENTSNKNMGAKYPEYAGYLESVNERTFDLMGIFSKGLYIDAKFRGSYSIKNVLPVLTGLGYEHLEIKEGSAAAAMWLRMAAEQMSEEKRDGIRAGLLEYCALDTRAMAEIMKTLKSEFCA
jgi:hypothetical protein